MTRRRPFGIRQLLPEIMLDRNHINRLAAKLEKIGTIAKGLAGCPGHPRLRGGRMGRMHRIASHAVLR